MRTVFILLFFAFFVPQSFAAAPITTQARHALLVDMGSGRVLLEKSADERIVPASMTKIMTLVMVMEALRNHRIALTEKFHISNNAWRKGGAPSGTSTMFLNPKSYVSIEDLIRGLVVQSGNDAAIALAEGLESRENAFAQRMTEHGKEIGLTDTVFRNATGLPRGGHFTTPRDLVRMVIYTINNFPEHYHYYAETEFTWNGITQKNRNPILFEKENRWFVGDGLKTGYTKDSGYSLTASAHKDGRRVIMVLTGLPSRRARADEARRLLEWSFRTFREYVFFKKGEVIDTAPIWHGSQERLPLTVERDVSATLSRDERRRIQVKLFYEAPVIAPVVQGQKIGVVRVLLGDELLSEVPLLAKEGSERVGVLRRAFHTLRYNLLN